MMANLSERDRKALQLGGIGVGVILLLMFVGFPVMGYWDGLNAEVTKKQQQLSSMGSDVTQALEASRLLASLQEKAVVHPDAASLKRQTAQMLQQIGRVPGYTRIAVRRLEPLPLRDEEKFHRSAVSLQFSGTLGDLHQFLKGVESARPALKVERLSIVTDAKESSRLEGQIIIAQYAVVMQKGRRG